VKGVSCSSTTSRHRSSLSATVRLASGWQSGAINHQLDFVLFGRGCPLVVHCWADLQSVHGFRCYDNIHVRKLIALYTANVYSVEREMSASAYTRSMTGFIVLALKSYCSFLT